MKGLKEKASNVSKLMAMYEQAQAELQDRNAALDSAQAEVVQMRAQLQASKAQVSVTNQSASKAVSEAVSEAVSKQS